MSRRPALALALLALLAGCGGDGDGVSYERGRLTAGAPQIDPALSPPARGKVAYCTPKDISGTEAAAIRRFNHEHADQALRATLVELPSATADETRRAFVQLQRRRSPRCDVLAADVIWTAEFASQRWLYDLTPYLRSRASEFIPSTLDTAAFDGRYWAVPSFTNAGFLYYRTNRVPSQPASWQEAYARAGSSGGLVYQGAAYEGLTVNFLELAYAAGGEVLSPDGRESRLSSPENLDALRFMVGGVAAAAVPSTVTKYDEERSRAAFESGRAAFMRNWPYAYALARRSKIADRFAVMPLPPFAGGTQAGVLGGQNLMISAYSRNPAAALRLVDHLTSAKAVERAAVSFAMAPPLQASYEDPDVMEAIPFSAQLEAAVRQARARPVSPVYADISRAIATNVHAALNGEISPEQALARADGEIEAALQAF